MLKMTAIAAVVIMAVELVSLADQPPEPVLHASKRGKLVFAQDMDQPLGERWRTGKGKWQVSEGAVRGVEVAAENHAASARLALPLHNAAIQIDIKLDGARFGLLKLNSASHCCQVIVRPDGLSLQRYADSDAEKKWVPVDNRSLRVAENKWHTVTLEMHGPQVVASFDQETVLRGEHSSIDVDKTTVILNVGGDGASFRNLRIWDALPKEN